MGVGDLSLYSTATQTSCVVPWSWLSPPTQLFCVGDTNMLVSENAKICVFRDAKHKICFSPDAKPQRQPVEYRLRWVPGVESLRWACTFHIFCVDFICCCVADANEAFSGIWALHFALITC